MSHELTLSEMIFLSNHCQIPETIPDIIDVCGEAGFMINVMPTTISEMQITIRCGERIIDGVIENGAIVEAKHIDENGLKSEIVILGSEPNLIPVPEVSISLVLTLVIVSFLCYRMIKMLK